MDVTSGDEPFKGIPVEIKSAEEAREALRAMGVSTSWAITSTRPTIPIAGGACSMCSPSAAASNANAACQRPTGCCATSSRAGSRTVVDARAGGAALPARLPSRRRSTLLCAVNEQG